MVWGFNVKVEQEKGYVMLNEKKKKSLPPFLLWIELNQPNLTLLVKFQSTLCFLLIYVSPTLSPIPYRFITRYYVQHKMGFVRIGEGVEKCVSVLFRMARKNTLHNTFPIFFGDPPSSMSILCIESSNSIVAS